MRYKHAGRLFLMVLLVLMVVGVMIILPCSRAEADYMYEHDTTSGTLAYAWGSAWLGQTFTGESAHYVNTVRLLLFRFGSPGSIQVSIRTVNPDGHPGDTILASGSTDGNTLIEGGAGAWRDVLLNTSYHVHKGSRYAIVVSAVSGNSVNCFAWLADSTAGYAGGLAQNSNSSGADWVFTQYYSETTHSYYYPDFSFQLRYDGSLGLWADTYYQSGDSVAGAVKGPQWLAQTFTLDSNMSVACVDLKVYRVGLPGQVFVAIQQTDGFGYPEGFNKAFGYLDGNSLAETAGWYRVYLWTPYHLRAGVKYALVLNSSVANDTNYVAWRYSTLGFYSGGNRLQSLDYGSTWNNQGSWDCMFKIYGVPTAFLAIFRQGGTWYIDYNRNGSYKASTDLVFGPFGQQAGDRAVAIDWGGETRQCMAVFRGGAWFIDTNHNGRYDSGIDYTNSPNTFGSTPGDRPLAVDQTAVGYERLALFRPGGSWFIDTNWNGRFDLGSDTSFVNSLGKNAGDIGLFIDWDGDGKHEMAAFRPSTGMWYIDMDHSGTYTAAIDTQLGPFGTTVGDIPLAIDWDGDGWQEACIFRTTGPDKGKWYIDNNHNGSFNEGWDLSFGPFGSTAGDQPLVIWWTQ